MNDEEFDAKLECLNALYGMKLHGANLWEYVEARKQHTDEFGRTVEKGGALRWKCLNFFYSMRMK